MYTWEYVSGISVNPEIMIWVEAIKMYKDSKSLNLGNASHAYQRWMFWINGLKSMPNFE